jgi:hypothetical protein
MAAPEKFCLNLMGDGAFGMSGTDIETSQRVRRARNGNSETDRRTSPWRS